MPRRRARPLVARERPAVVRSAVAGRRSRVCLRLVSSAGVARVAAGVTWERVIASAPWVARYRHTTVIDAASGAIYVIGGGSGTTTFHKDVWVSTDGGAHRTRTGVLERYDRGGALGANGATLAFYAGCLRGSSQLPWGCSSGSSRSTGGVSMGT